MSYDLIVIGGGPGGYISAIKASQKGLNVAIIEKDALGGTCANVGCIPTKVYAHAASIINEIKKANAFGITAEYNVNLDLLRAKKESVVKRLTAGIQYLLTKNKVTVIKGEAKFLDNHTIQVNDQAYRASNFIIASGSKLLIPPIKGIDLPGVLTTNEALDMERIPEKILIIGAGIVGLEFCNIYQALGSEVILVDILPDLLPMLDRDIASVAEKVLVSKNIQVLLNHKVEEIEAGLYVRVEKDGNRNILGCDTVLLAAGRSANVNGIEALNLQMWAKGIKVNQQMKTSIDNIYCVGDVNGLSQLAHVAAYQGEIAVENILGENVEADLNTVPNCIYTDPEIAWVGLSEIQARESYGNIVVGSFPYLASGRAQTMSEDYGLVKVITEAKYKRLLGMEIIGPYASELIQQGVLAIRYEFSVQEIISSIFAHPTLSECIKEACDDVMGLSVHKG